VSFSVGGCVRSSHTFDDDEQNDFQKCAAVVPAIDVILSGKFDKIRISLSSSPKNLGMKLQYLRVSYQFL